ncbi:MAG: hypothetical protein FJX92_01810 [Bacteroidetes bacterium]|nr:hypothetical protein [Bacteroidota bacterium]
MKKLLYLLLLLPLFPLNRLKAQGMGFGQRATVEERVSRITQKLDSAFAIDSGQLVALDTALKVLFRRQEERRQEMMNSGETPDRETIMAEMKKFSDIQDDIISTILTKEEFLIWKEKIQPTMRPRGMGGPGGPGGPGGGGGGQRRERNNQ